MAQGDKKRQEWIFERCREVQLEPNGMLDLWAREHYKSTIITFGLTIQDILNDPELTVGIFSFTRPIAKGFLRQIKREFEGNENLKGLFPEILWANPKKEASKWSEDDGIIVKRTGNPKESTIQAWGLVDGQPTSAHYKLMVYDDVITRESVTTPDMVKKVTDAWELSLNLTSEQGGKVRYIGTRYHFGDTYSTIIKRRSAIERRHPGTNDGTMEGFPVMWDLETMKKKRRDMGPYTFSCQILQNPRADEAVGFKAEWLRYWPVAGWEQMNRYILVDPAGSKKKLENDWSVIMVIGLGYDRNYYLIDMVRDRLNLTERTNTVFEFHRKYRPVGVGYEEYGAQSDKEHIEFCMDLTNYRFTITPLGGKLGKHERINRLIPIFEQGRMWLPGMLWKTLYDGQSYDIIDLWRNEEYLAYPVCLHDDGLDAMARILDDDMAATFPEMAETPEEQLARFGAGMAEQDYGNVDEKRV